MKGQGEIMGLPTSYSEVRLWSTFYPWADRDLVKLIHNRVRRARNLLGELNVHFERPLSKRLSDGNISDRVTK